jgi:acyl-CoA dehydrogenase
MFTPCPTERSRVMADRVEAFVRDVVVPYEKDIRATSHGPSAELVTELRAKARAAGVMTPHILPDGEHMTQLETAAVLKRSGLSPLGPVAVNTMAPDEGNMFLLGKAATPAQQERFLQKLVSGHARSAFFMTEPAAEGGAGSDPSMLRTRVQARTHR